MRVVAGGSWRAQRLWRASLHFGTCRTERIRRLFWERWPSWWGGIGEGCGLTLGECQASPTAMLHRSMIDSNVRLHAATGVLYNAKAVTTDVIITVGD